MICHNLDVMHIENKFFDNIFNMLMCVPGKKRDHLKARQDLVMMLPHEISLILNNDVIKIMGVTLYFLQLFFDVYNKADIKI